MSARLAFYMIRPEERRKLVQFIKNNFILVDVDGYAPGGSNEERSWWTKISGNTESNGCGNNAWYLATARGTRLADPVSRGLPDVRKAWILYKSMPDDDRRPALPKPILDNPKKARLTPPAGALILRAYFNALEASSTGDPVPVKRMRWYSEIIPSRFPGTEVLWVTEKEWKAMIPATPRKGEKLAFPETLQHRILRYYSAPELVGWNNTDWYLVRSFEFSLTVDEASADGFKLKLEGFARKGKEFSEKDVTTLGGDFRFLGYLHFDAKKKAFDRFDVVALGKAWGGGGEPINGSGKGPIVAYVPVYEQEARPYNVGLAYTLVSGERPVDRVPPGPGANGYPGWAPEHYLGKQ
jgi:hypothetical protein